MEISCSERCEVNIIFINGKISEQTSKIACLNYAEFLDMVKLLDCACFQ